MGNKNKLKDKILILNFAMLMFFYLLGIIYFFFRKEYCFALMLLQEDLISLQLIGLFNTIPLMAIHYFYYNYPIETKEYIHRVGRTCRGANARGKALIFLLPSELDYLKHLKLAKVDLLIKFFFIYFKGDIK